MMNIHNRTYVGFILYISRVCLVRVLVSPLSVCVLFCRHLVAALRLHAFCGLVENEIS
jgi:hypothetical protein